VLLHGALHVSFSQEEVTFPSVSIETRVREAAGLNADQPITKAVVSRIRELDLSMCRCENIVFITDFTSFHELDLAYNDIEDISPLAELSEMGRLSIRYNDVSDISPLAGLKLWRVCLGGNTISDISPLAGHTSLAILELADNPITDYSPLSELEEVGLCEVYK
jgi:internalin A